MILLILISSILLQKKSFALKGAPVVDKNLICNTITLFRSVQLFCVCGRKAPARPAGDKP